MSALCTYHVWRLVDGKWQFWMNARSTSTEKLKRAVMYYNRSMKPENVKVTDTAEKEEE